jgi:hypothetical protein
VPTPRTRAAALALLLLVIPLTACADDGDDTGDRPSTTAKPAGPTVLAVSGTATQAGSDPTAPIEVPFSYDLDCTTGEVTTRRGAVGEGEPLADEVDDICDRLARDPSLLTSIGPDPDRICTEIYGGPQVARIEGTVNGTAVAVDVTRNDGCGIDDWDSLEFLLGAPERE